MAIPRVGWEVTAVPERLDSATGIETSRELFGGVIDLSIGGAVEQGKRKEVQVLVQHSEGSPYRSLRGMRKSGCTDGEMRPTLPGRLQASYTIAHSVWDPPLR